MFDNRAADHDSPGPNVVALGGGHGLAASLRAARAYAGNITAVVSVGDDGGSSGRLRAEFGVSPPGDIRRCLSALANDELLLGRSLEYRFDEGPLSGHPIGNLLLIGLAFSGGDLQAAVDEVARVVGARGRVIPATTVPVVLIADSDRGTITGQVTIERAAGIRNLRFDPPNPPATVDAIAAVVSADQVVIGPGSLFTSVLATAVVDQIRSALDRTNGQRIFVANVANDKAEARGFGLEEHLEAVADHGIPVDLVIADCPVDVEPFLSVSRSQSIPILHRHIAAEDGWSHDPVRLGKVLSEALDLVHDPAVTANRHQSQTS